MKHLQHILLVGMLMSMLSTLTLAQTADEARNLHLYPYLQWATPNSIIIKWETLKPTIGTVTYGEFKEARENKETETQAVTLHEIKLTGLQAATQYTYQVQYDGIKLEPATFTTAPVPGTPNWRMVAYGDNRTHPETHKKIVDQVLKLNPSMIIHSGDLVSRGDVYEQWKEQYFDPMRGLSENIAVFPSLGNHERNHQNYYDYMSLPDENGESFYSFDYGNAHFIALNSNSDEEPYGPDSKQTQWLIKDLEANKDAEWKIVFFHHPLFRCHPTRGIEEQRWVWQEVFEKHGIDLVVNGHDHYYQRTYAVGNYQGEPSRGVYHVISGGGGAPNYPIVPKVHAANRRSVHHFTVMDFMGDRIVGRAIDAEGNIFDAFVFDKEAENAPEEFISYEVFEIERDLAAAIIQLPVFEENKSGISISQHISLPNPFKHPLKMTLKWEGSANWETGAATEVILKPGQNIEIPMELTIRNKAYYPLPTASLSFRKPDGELAFKNDKIVFSPVKTAAAREVVAQAITKTPKLDGDLSEEVWNTSTPIAGFLGVQHGHSPKQATQIQVIQKNNKLFIGGTVAATRRANTSRDTIRDHRNVYRYENVQVYIGVGDTVYSFAVNPAGALHDTKNGAVSWNSKAKSAAIATSEGWQFELMIPMKALKTRDQALRINFVRHDRENREVSEFCRTFGASELDHYIPMYESDGRAVERFATLKLE